MLVGYEWYDFLGNVGVAFIVGSYFFLQLGKISGQSPVYSVLNGVGAVFVLVSLYYDYNLSAVMVESFWLLISIFGFVTNTRKRTVLASLTKRAGSDYR